MKIIIAGGRDYKEKLMTFLILEKLLLENEITYILSGRCGRQDKFNKEKRNFSKGGDGIGEKVAFKLGIPIRSYVANWKKHGKSAGPIRNEEMAKIADGCILLPGGKGIANMKANAIKYCLKFWEIK